MATPSPRDKYGGNVKNELPAMGVCCQQQTALLEQISSHGVCSRHIEQTD